MARKSKKIKTSRISNIPIPKERAGGVVDHKLDLIAKDNYYKYSVAVNEDRAIPAAIDGMKPVIRRAMWAVHKLGVYSKDKPVKSANAVGVVMGKYHPHGDSSIYSSYVTMRNSPMPLIEGIGNWGSLTNSSAAAPRYTELRMSKYAELVFFDKFYFPTIQYVPNYDGSTVEPLILPSLLPNLLLNGTLGIGVGVRTETPCYTVDSLIGVIQECLKQGKNADIIKLCRDLKFTSLYEGKPVMNKQVRKDLRIFYKKGTGRVDFRSPFTLEGRTVIIERFAPFSNLSNCLMKAKDKESDLQSVNDVSDIADKHGKVELVFKKTVPEKKLEKEASRIVKTYFSAKESYDIKITTRFLDKQGEAGARLSSSTVPKIIEEWISYRLDLEDKACTYWISERKKEIADLELMRLAVKNRKFIIQALDKGLEDSKLVEYVAKHLKITLEQANQILDLKVRRLNALEDSKLVAKIKELEKEIATYKLRQEKPAEYVVGQLSDLKDKLGRVKAETKTTSKIRKKRKAKA